MVDGLVAAVAVLLWAAAAHQLARLRRQPYDAGLRALVVALAALAVAATLFVERLQYELFDPGQPNVADLVARLAVMVAAWSGQRLLLHLVAAPVVAAANARRDVAGLLAASCSVLALWMGAVAHAGGGKPLSGSIWAVGYMGVFLGYLGVSLWRVGWGTLRFARPAGGPLGVGLHLVAVGCGFGLAYIGMRLGTTLWLPEPGQLARAVPVALAVLGGSLVAGGAGLPSLALLAARPWRALGAYRAHRRLYPLWAALREVEPGIALDPAPSRLADALRVRDVDFRLSRRIVEIRDGRLALRDYLDGDIADAAHSEAVRRGRPAASAAAAAEAAAIRAAPQRRLTGARCARPVRGFGGGGEDLAAETAWFLMVAEHFQEAPSSGRGGRPAGRTGVASVQR